MDGTFTISCSDGTEVILTNGQDASATPVLLAIVQLPFFNPICTIGGNEISIGSDLDTDGELDAAEVTDQGVACPL